MRASKDLFELIKSMTQTEKRYFKIFASLHVKGEMNNYVKLFDAIEGQKEYNETEIKKQFRGLRQLPVAKNYLYNLALKSLCSYHNEKSAFSRTGELINGVKILNKKALREQSGKLLLRAKKSAEEYEHFSQLLEILIIELKMEGSKSYYPGYEKRFTNLLNEIRRTLDKINNEVEYYQFFCKYLPGPKKDQVYRTKAQETFLSRMINHPLLHDEKKAFSFESKNIFYNMSYYYYFKKGDLRKCYEFAKKQQELYNSNKKLMLEYIERYILVTNDLLTFQKRLGKIDEFKTTLAHLRELPAKYGNLIDESYQISIIVPTYYMELSYFIESGNFEKGEKLMGDIEAYLNQIGEKVEKHRGALIYFRAALLYFILENNNRSLYWLNKILNDASPAIPREISSDSRILNLLIHFELQDFDLLEYTLKSTYRYLTKIEKLYKFETVILDFIRKSFKIKTNSELMDGFRKLKVKLVELSKDEYERKPLVNLNLIPWLESKIEKRKFAEVLKERAG